MSSEVVKPFVKNIDTRRMLAPRRPIGPAGALPTRSAPAVQPTYPSAYTLPWPEPANAS